MHRTMACLYGEAKNKQDALITENIKLRDRIKELEPTPPQ